MALRLNVADGLLILEISRSHNDVTQSVGLLWTSDQPEAGDLYLTQNTHNRQTNVHDSGGKYSY